MRWSETASSVRCRAISNRASLLSRLDSHCVVFTGFPLVGLACASAVYVPSESGDDVWVWVADGDEAFGPGAFGRGEVAFVAH